MPTDAIPQMQKYLFKAHAIALRGSIRKPYHQELGNHLEIATYAGSAGRVSSQRRGFSVSSDIFYESASTEIIAERFEEYLYQTIVTTRVENLRVGSRLTVEEVTSRLRSVYDARQYPSSMTARILPAGSMIRGLSIDGKQRDLQMPPAFRLDERQQDQFFRGGQTDDAAIYYPGDIPAPLYVEGVGTIYYAEWAWVHPQERHRQHLTMLRLALGSDLGADVDAGYSDNDGSGWPPLAP